MSCLDGNIGAPPWPSVLVVRSRGRATWRGAARPCRSTATSVPAGQLERELWLAAKLPPRWESGAVKLRHVGDLKARSASSVATSRRQPGRAFRCRVRSFERSSCSTGGPCRLNVPRDGGSQRSLWAVGDHGPHRRASFGCCFEAFGVQRAGCMGPVPVCRAYRAYRSRSVRPVTVGSKPCGDPSPHRSMNLPEHAGRLWRWRHRQSARSGTARFEAHRGRQRRDPQGTRYIWLRSQRFSRTAFSHIGNGRSAPAQSPSPGTGASRWRHRGNGALPPLDRRAVSGNDDGHR